MDSWRKTSSPIKYLMFMEYLVTWLVTKSSSTSPFEWGAWPTLQCGIKKRYILSSTVASFKKFVRELFSSQLDVVHVTSCQRQPWLEVLEVRVLASHKNRTLVLHVYLNSRLTHAVQEWRKRLLHPKTPQTNFTATDFCITWLSWLLCAADRDVSWETKIKEMEQWVLKLHQKK